jgi:hypothetical protein
MLRRGASPHSTVWNTSPLIVAVWAGDFEVVQLLVEMLNQIAVPLTWSDSGNLMDAFDLACALGRKELAEYLGLFRWAGPTVDPRTRLFSYIQAGVKVSLKAGHGQPMDLFFSWGNPKKGDVLMPLTWEYGPWDYPLRLRDGL